MHTSARPKPTNSAISDQAGKLMFWVTTPLLMVVVGSGVCDHPNAPPATTMRKRTNVLANAPFAVMCDTRRRRCGAGRLGVGERHRRGPAGFVFLGDLIEPLVAQRGVGHVVLSGV